MSREQALAFGAMWLLAQTVASAIGGLIAFLSGDMKILRSKEAVDAEAEVALVR